MGPLRLGIWQWAHHDGAMPDDSFEIPQDLTDAESFKFWTIDTLRWGDQDSMGHINNVQFARFCESGRVAALEAATEGRRGSEHFMLVKLTVNFRAQMRYPGEIRVGTRVLSIGRSSIRFVQGLFYEGICTATSDAVIVMVDRADDRPCEVPPGLRDKLMSLTT